MRSIWNFIKKLFGYGSPPVVVTIPELPEVIGTPGFYLGKIKGAYESEITMIKDAIHLLEKVVRSPYFEDEMMRAKFSRKNDKTNQDIFEMYTTRAFTVNVDIFSGSWAQNHWYKTVGYENGDGFVHVNRYFLTDYKMLASLIAHEIAHELSFSHTSASDSTSVPYFMNAIVERVTEKVI